MFFVSTCTRGAPPLLALHRASWLWPRGLACSIPPALGDAPGPSRPCCVAEEGVPIDLRAPSSGMGVPAQSRSVQARPQQLSPAPRASPVGCALPRGDQHKKCKETGLGPPRHQVISVWLDLTSPGFARCVGIRLPSPPQTTSAKGCWAGATLTLCRDKSTHPLLVRGEERAAVPESRDLMEGGGPAGISPTVRGQGSVPERREGRVRGMEGCG